MTPTIGRIVHYQAPADCGGDVYAAIVVGARVEVPTIGPSITRVDLVTFGPRSIYHHAGVLFFGDVAAPGAAYWPPRES